MKTYGIDLGTTYSCLAEIDNVGKPVVVKLPECNNVTTFPSVVAYEQFDDKIECIVGQLAKDKLLEEDNHVCTCIKREMGSREYKFPCFGKEYSPEEISNEILRGLIKASQREDVRDVVITVPAYFGAEHRAATKAAGRLAHLNVIDVIEEPTAAALAYGIDLKEEKNILVYDLGGGTFDATILHVKDSTFDPIATDGNHHLGGEDWDNVLKDYLISKYSEQTGKSEEIIRDNYEFMANLIIKAEQCKRRLTANPQCRVTLNNNVRVEITREKFDELTDDLLKQTIDKTCKVIGMAKKKEVTRIDLILLVGGSTMMPQVKERIHKAFPDIEISIGVNPHEAVALGAAIYAQNLVQKATDPGLEPVLPPININRIITKSYAIKCIDRKVDPDRVIIQNYIFRNTRLPIDAFFTFHTREDNQKAASLQLYENNLEENEREYNIVLEEDDPQIIIDGELSPLPMGLRAGSKITINIKVDNNGHFTLHAEGEEGGRADYEVDLVNSISEDEMRKIQEESDNRTIYVN